MNKLIAFILVIFSFTSMAQDSCLKALQDRLDLKDENTYTDRYIERWADRIEELNYAGTTKTKVKVIGKMTGLTALGLVTWPYAALDSGLYALHKKQTRNLRILVKSAVELLKNPSIKELKEIENTPIAELSEKMSSKKNPNSLEKVIKIAKILIFGNATQGVCKQNILNGQPRFNGELMIRLYIKKQLKLTKAEFDGIDSKVSSVLSTEDMDEELEQDEEDEDFEDESLNRLPGKESEDLELNDLNTTQVLTV